MAYVYAEQGVSLALVARRADRLDEVAKRCRTLHASSQIHVETAVADVTDFEGLKAAVVSLKSKLGTIDTVVANAGYAATGAVEKVPLETYRKQFDTNIFGVLHTLKATLPDVIASRGRVALVGSVNSHVSEPYKTPYCMSKFAIKALADALHFEMKPQGVSVTLFSPGIVESEIRRVSNEGTFRSDAQDLSPAWLRMPTMDAAREMVQAIERRKRWQIITGHARLIVFLNWLCPKLLEPVFKSQEHRYRQRES